MVNRLNQWLNDLTSNEDQSIVEGKIIIVVETFHFVILFLSGGEHPNLNR